MKRAIWFVLIFFLCFSACSPVQQTAFPTPVASPQGTATLLLRATPSATEKPTFAATPTKSETPPPPRRTSPQLPLTPLPTFDRSNADPIRTRPKALCPTIDPSVYWAFAQSDFFQSADIFDYLNAGGDPEFFEQNPQLLKGRSLDLTGDGSKEFIYAMSNDLLIWSCKTGKYEQVLGLVFNENYFIELQEIVDLNQNGVPEIVISAFRNEAVADIYLYEWAGDGFHSLVSYSFDAFDATAISNSVPTARKYELKDLNGDGLQEIIIVNDMYTYYRSAKMLPAYDETVILGWDGLHYTNMTPGNYQKNLRYRFHATLLGDQATLSGNYQQALAFYHEAIFNAELERSPSLIYTPSGTKLTPIPGDLEDAALAAYAYYRTMILHVRMAETLQAQLDYNTIQTKFPPGNAAHPYAEMADAFWREYLAQGSLVYACARAGDYAFAHPEILGLLRIGVRAGWQSHEYQSYDVCPFS